MLFLILIIVALIAVVVIYQAVKLRRAVSENLGPRQPTHPEMLTELTFSADSISAKYPDGGIISMKWSELTNIGLASTAAAPGDPSLYWGLHSGKQVPTITYPHGTVGDKELLAEFARRLPGFDMEKVMQAVAATGRAHFQVWSKK
ncbi:MAG TPA: hypothetical protein VF798_08815 [Burkholderiaceae bacterium]